MFAIFKVTVREGIDFDSTIKRKTEKRYYEALEMIKESNQEETAVEGSDDKKIVFKVTNFKIFRTLI